MKLTWIETTSFCVPFQLFEKALTRVGAVRREMSGIEEDVTTGAVVGTRVFFRLVPVEVVAHRGFVMGHDRGCRHGRHHRVRETR